MGNLVFQIPPLKLMMQCRTMPIVTIPGVKMYLVIIIKLKPYKVNLIVQKNKVCIFKCQHLPISKHLSRIKNRQHSSCSFHYKCMIFTIPSDVMKKNIQTNHHIHCWQNCKLQNSPKMLKGQITLFKVILLLS